MILFYIPNAQKTHIEYSTNIVQMQMCGMVMQ